MEKEIILRREKHLDHMVRVVPFICFMYAVHSYFIFNYFSSGFTQNGLFFMGGFLAFIVGLFVVYDLKHSVVLNSRSMKIKFFGFEKEILKKDITDVSYSNQDQSFCTVTIFHKNGKEIFFFVDSDLSLSDWLKENDLNLDEAA